MSEKIEIRNYRQPEQEINPLILKRWSPRALSREEISQAELMALFEAAKWAPSAFNEQPWRFIYSLPNTPSWEKLFNLLAEPNQLWAKNAAALILFISKKTFAYNGKENINASFDTGSAWENLALEASSRGLVAHAMAGFDYAAARTTLNISGDYNIEAMVAIGRPGDKEELPEKMRANEFPSDRRKIALSIAEGEFKF